MATACVREATVLDLVEILQLSKERRMTTVYVIGGIVSAGLFVYLLVALLKPEVFS